MIVDFDPLRKVFFEQQPPEEAFVKTHTDTGPSITRMADSPLTYLRFRSPKPIGEIQYLAALRYLEDHTLSSGIGSSTAAMCDTAARMELTKAEKERAKALADGRLTLTADGRDEWGPRRNPEALMLQRLARRRKYAEALEPFDKFVLDKVVVMEIALGTVSQRMKMPAEAVGQLIRIALWRLARLLEVVDAEFAEQVAAIREQEAALERESGNGAI